MGSTLYKQPSVWQEALPHNHERELLPLGGSCVVQSTRYADLPQHLLHEACDWPHFAD